MTREPDTTRDRSFVVGTAGHVDHGKSTLVKALTGVDPDRLAEEKVRGMTIDLGFASLRTPGGHEVGIVDVPGHERFIKNMLAGVGGIDAAILVVAADEGPMPQTDEHLAILDLLGVGALIVVLSKIDLVDGEWLELVTEEIRELLSGTLVAGAPVVRLSARSGQGLSSLLETLDRVLAQLPPRLQDSTSRLPIDRVFTLRGFGTVVTGTLVGGTLTVGQELRIMPGNMPVRVRGLQSHAQKIERAMPGTRVAVNITGANVDEIERGDVLAPAGVLNPTLRLDVRLQLLSNAPVTLKQNDAVDFFAGSAERRAWVTLLDRDELPPGERSWVQLRFREPVVAIRGDRFIIRRPSPSITIGGGTIVDSAPVRHKRFRPEVTAALDVLATGTPTELVVQSMGNGPTTIKDLRLHVGASLSDGQLFDVICELIESGQCIKLGGFASDQLRPESLVIAASAWAKLSEQVVRELSTFHVVNPLRAGMSKEELRSRLGMAKAGRAFDEATALAIAEGVMVVDRAVVRLPSFRIELDMARRRAADQFLAAVKASPVGPPSPTDFGLDDETLGALVELQEVVKVSDDVVYDPSTFAAIESGVTQILEERGEITIAGFRDHFGSSRKYAQATLEYLDQRRITRRVGDVRVKYGGSQAGRTSAEAP